MYRGERLQQKGLDIKRVHFGLNRGTGVRRDHDERDGGEDTVPTHHLCELGATHRFHQQVADHEIVIRPAKELERLNPVGYVVHDLIADGG